MVDSAEKASLVSRVRDLNDARATRVTLFEAGDEVLRRLAAWHQTAWQRLIAQLDNVRSTGEPSE
jgi:DNA-binding MarR family transcriptional regulator